jgi:hypothetical protein
MFFLRILIVLITVAFSTSLLASPHECTYLDKTYWIPVETFKSKLVRHGRKLVDFKVVGSCYEAVVQEMDGRVYEGLYDPASGHPLHRQLKK